MLLLLSAAWPVIGDSPPSEKTWSIKGAIQPSGGRYFHRRVELRVPSFVQRDARWRHEPLGSMRITMGTNGCAVASAAMVLASYGFDVDPQRLNRFLDANNGYTAQGGLHWEAAAEYDPGKVHKAYEGLPTYDLIDSNLASGNPVIVRVATKGGPHFVVIAGKEGFDYLTRDPGTGAALGLYPLRMFRTQIDALRIYERL